VENIMDGVSYGIAKERKEKVWVEETRKESKNN
jgi:hypothetical protein